MPVDKANSRGCQPSTVSLTSSYQVLTTLLFCVEIVRAAVCRSQIEEPSQALIASTSLSSIAAVCTGLMLFLEHYHATQSSSLLTLYLTITIIVDFLRAFYYTTKSELHFVGTLSAVTTTIKISLLVQQEAPKYLDPRRAPHRGFSPEATTGFWNRTLGLWLNSTLLFGFRRTLRMADLANLGTEFSSANLSFQFDAVWATGNLFLQYNDTHIPILLILF